MTQKSADAGGPPFDAMSPINRTLWHAPVGRHCVVGISQWTSLLFDGQIEPPAWRQHAADQTHIPTFDAALRLHAAEL
jgi:hypothetical protein